MLSKMLIGLRLDEARLVLDKLPMEYKLIECTSRNKHFDDYLNIQRVIKLSKKGDFLEVYHSKF